MRYCGLIAKDNATPIRGDLPRRAVDGGGPIAAGLCLNCLGGAPLGPGSCPKCIAAASPAARSRRPCEPVRRHAFVRPVLVLVALPPQPAFAALHGGERLPKPRCSLPAAIARRSRLLPKRRRC